MESPLPSVSDVLALPVLADGLPEVLAAARNLDRPVRWVHVIESAGIARLLNGQELVLATGVGWPSSETELRAYVRELSQANASALVLELGRRYSSVPAALAQACEVNGLPLIVLHREVKFVSVTEAIHSYIIAGQMSALRARDEIHALFSELSRRGSPPDYVVERLSDLLGAPIVLEDLSHRVVAFEGGRTHEATLLKDWERRSRIAHQTGARRTAFPPFALSTDEPWLITPVEARGMRWGYLIMLAQPGTGTVQPDPSQNQIALEQAAMALAMGCLANGGADEWARLGHQSLVEAVLDGRYASQASLSARLEAAGLPLDQRRAVGLSLRVAGTVPGAEVMARVTMAAQSLGGAALCSLRNIPGEPGVLVALGLPPNRGPEQAINLFAAELRRLSSQRITLAAGRTAVDVESLARSLQESIQVLGAAPSDRPDAVHRGQGLEFRLLLGELREDHRLRRYAEETLGPLLAHDAAHGSYLMDVLRAYLAHPGNRSKAAEQSHVSRSVFYQRLALIEELLGVDLSSGETIAGLHAAVLAIDG